MTFGISNIFKISIKMRKLLRVSQYTIPVRLINKSYVKCIANEAGNSKILEPQEFNFKEICEKIQQKRYNWDECKHNSQIFKMINDSKNLNSTEAVEALVVLYKLNEKNTDLLKRRNEFKLLCLIINNNLQNLSSLKLIKMFEILQNLKFKLPYNIMDSIIEKLSQSLSNLPLNQITFLFFLLSKNLYNSQQTEALKIAISIVLQCYVNTNFRSENIDSLIYSLLNMSQFDVENEFTSNIIKALNKYPNFNSKQATNILLSLCTLKSKNNDAELVEKVENIIIQNIYEISPTKLVLITKKVSQKVTLGENYFYNEKLIESIVQIVILKNLKVYKAVDILSYLTKISYTSLQLLDYIFDKLYKNKFLIDKLDVFEIVKIISAMSLANYKPIFWNSLKDLFLTVKIFEMKVLILIQIALYLVTLDHYWPQLLERIFQDQIFNNHSEIILEKEYKKYLLLLHYAVLTFYSDYTGPLLSDDVIQKIRDSLELQVDNDYPLKSALESSLGGPQYVKTHIKTDFAYHIDHLVIMRKGGFPIAINNEEKPSAVKFSDIHPIPGSQVLLFLYTNEKNYSKNTKNFTGLQLLKMKMLKLKPNYKIIPICSDLWNILNEPKQIQYITQMIQLNNDEFQKNYY